MRTLYLILFLLLYGLIQLQAQTRLNVEGDANILGRIFTNVADRSVLIIDGNVFDTKQMLINK